MLSRKSLPRNVIRIGPVGIPKKYGAKIRAVGSDVDLSVSIVGDKDIIAHLNGLEKGKLYELESQKYNCIVQIEKVTVDKEEIGDQVITHFFIHTKMKSR